MTDRASIRTANQQTWHFGWITCEHCGAPRRDSWFVSGDMCFCSWEHLDADAQAAAGPPQRYDERCDTTDGGRRCLHYAGHDNDHRYPEPRKDQT